MYISNITFTSTIVEFLTSLSLFVISKASEVPCTETGMIFFAYSHHGPFDFWLLTFDVLLFTFSPWSFWLLLLTFDFWHLKTSHHGPGSIGCSHLSVSISLKSFSTHTSSHSSIVLNLLLFPEEEVYNTWDAPWSKSYRGSLRTWIVHRSLAHCCNHSGNKSLRKVLAPLVDCKPRRWYWKKNKYNSASNLISSSIDVM